MPILPIDIMTNDVTVTKKFTGGFAFNRREVVLDPPEELLGLDEALILQIINGNILVHQRTVTDDFVIGDTNTGQDIILPAFFISPTGNDSTGDGSEASPWKTISKARNEMRTAGAISHTYLRGGRYDYNNEAVIPIALTSADNNITYLAYPGETPDVSGGDLILGANFSDEGGGIYSSPVLGTPSELDVVLGDGSLLHPCQHPTPTDGTETSFFLMMTTGAIDDQITWTGADVIEADVNSTSAWLQSFPAVWNGFPGKITGYNVSAKTINATSYDGVSRSIGESSKANSMYRILNNADQHLSAMPTLTNYSGTFGYSSANSKLYVKPNTASDLTTNGAVIARKVNLFTLTGCDNITFLGITFSDTTTEGATQVSANGDNGHVFQLSASTNCKFGYNTFRAVNGAVAGTSGSTGLWFIENECSGLAQSAVWLNGSDDAIIYGNYIHDFGAYLAWDKTCPVSYQNCDDVEISRNYFLRLSQEGIAVRDGGSSSNMRPLIERNRLIQTCRYSADVGAIKFLGRSRTNLNGDVQHNYIDEARGLRRDQDDSASLVYFAGIGIYLDDQTTGVRCTSNFINRVSQYGIFNHSGDDNVHKKNVIVLHDNATGYVTTGGWREWAFGHQGNDGDMLRNEAQLNLIFAPNGLDRVGAGAGEYHRVSGTYYDSAGTNDPITDFNMLAGDPDGGAQLEFRTTNFYGNGGTPTAGDASSAKVNYNSNAVMTGYSLDGGGEMVPTGSIALTAYTTGAATGPSADLEWATMGGPFANKISGYDVSAKFALTNLWDQFNP